MVYGNGFEKMCQSLESWGKQQFLFVYLFVVFPVCFTLAKPYPFPLILSPLLASFIQENHQNAS